MMYAYDVARLIFSLGGDYEDLRTHGGPLGLQERMRGPKYDVFGPWPVAPAHIVNAYQGHSVI